MDLHKRKGLRHATSVAFLVLALSILTICLQPRSAAAADLIILQNTNEVEGEVTSFDEDGVQLKGKKLIGWDDILDGNVAKDQQPRFNKLLKELGEDLFRIRSRLKIGNYAGALPHAEKMYPRYKDRRSATAYMVWQALMWGRMAEGKREEAVEPMLRCYAYLRTTKNGDADLPGTRRLKYEEKSGICDELQMVWLDKDAARAAMPPLVPVIRNLKPPTAGAYLYYATLAFAAGETTAGNNVLKQAEQLQATDLEKDLVKISGAMNDALHGKVQPAIVALTAMQQQVSPELKPLHTFWLGYAESRRDTDREKLEGVVRMLRVPATYGKQVPEVSAAALYRAMQVLGDTGDAQGSVALRGELRLQYPQTAPALGLAAGKKKAAGE